jgi:hypothetical protein
LPGEFHEFIDHPNISSHSCILNLIFSFSAMETTSTFPSFAGGQGFIAVQGRIYHRIRPTHQDSTVCWLLYDGFITDLTPHPNWARTLPDCWMTAMVQALIHVNPFVQSLCQLARLPSSQFPEANLILKDNPSCQEVCFSYAIY